MRHLETLPDDGAPVTDPPPVVPAARRRRHGSVDAATRRRAIEEQRRTARTLDAAPDLLTIIEVAAFYRIGVSTIRRKLSAGTFKPLPVATRPQRWRKDDLRAHVTTTLDREQQKLADARRRRRQTSA